MIYVAARPVDRAPRGLGRTPGGCLVVVPGPDGWAAARCFEVAGCFGYPAGRQSGAAAVAASGGRGVTVIGRARVRRIRLAPRAAVVKATASRRPSAGPSDSGLTTATRSAPGPVEAGSAGAPGRGPARQGVAPRCAGRALAAPRRARTSDQLSRVSITNARSSWRVGGGMPGNRPHRQLSGHTPLAAGVRLPPARRRGPTTSLTGRRSPDARQRRRRARNAARREAGAMSATISAPDDPAVVATPISTPAPRQRANAGAPLLPALGRAADRVHGARRVGRAALDADARAGRAGAGVARRARSGVIAAGRDARRRAGCPTTRARTLAAVGALVPIAALMLMAGRVADELRAAHGLERAGGRDLARDLATCRASACPTAGSTSGSARRSRSAGRRSSRSPRCSRSGRGGPSSGSRGSRCSR